MSAFPESCTLVEFKPTKPAPKLRQSFGSLNDLAGDFAHANTLIASAPPLSDDDLAVPSDDRGAIDELVEETGWPQPAASIAATKAETDVVLNSAFFIMISRLLQID